MKKSVLKKYAKLIAVMGVNIQKGQEVIIAADLACDDDAYSLHLVSPVESARAWSAT